MALNSRPCARFVIARTSHFGLTVRRVLFGLERFLQLPKEFPHRLNVSLQRLAQLAKRAE
jgi:hypothetical protein